MDANHWCPVALSGQVMGDAVSGRAGTADHWQKYSGKHAKLYIGELEEVSCLERGHVFTQLRMRFRLPGTVRAGVFMKFYEAIPRIDFHLQLGKTLSSDIESVFLPLSLHLPDSSLYIRKGSESFRPGVEQIPGTCMEYYMSDDGLAYLSPKGSILIATRDTPLLYMGGNEAPSHSTLRQGGKPQPSAGILLDYE